MKQCYDKAACVLLFLLLFLYIGGGCERVTLAPDMTRTGFEYNPMALGHFRTYDTYRINYNFATENDTLQYQIKELVADFFLNQEGDTTFVTHKMHRQAGESSWKLDSISHWRQTPRQAIEHADNQDIVKLVFPVEEGKLWNSNVYNTLEADSFRMVKVHRPFIVAEQEYDQTLTVIHRNIRDTIVRQDIRREVFAQGIGPVYRLVKTLNYCATQECIGKGIIDSGLYQEMTLTDFGKE